MSGWIENKGEDCPVPHQSQVELKFDDGEALTTHTPEDWMWHRYKGDADGTGGTITHYRFLVHK